MPVGTCEDSAVVILVAQTDRDTAHPPTEYSIPPAIKTAYKPFWWNTQYSISNQTAQDEFWDAIHWSHGMITRDKKWAESQNWPDTMDLPSDHSKGVWLLEAYHEIHCLQILREVTKTGLGGQPSTIEKHVGHCLNTILQVIICHADSTPLRVTGMAVERNGQLRQCKDWEALRSYASEYSACYTPLVEGNTAADHFGNCDNGDGIVAMVSQPKPDK
ncbi:hypothetical protein UA08_06305 [Talaromyces atroroseus]|uniref:Uncharacterized protein n=1 Tax=Talaromyces atroroseus TaxID=1441469 RepID=A0A225ADX8_TALAT|nr:hypothetical protein UA08_06305 [Talaromyces atroroseus]OKL58690.1 hypothetical protein UA08_06305 [Talaromyces atroroseus]